MRASSAMPASSSSSRSAAISYSRLSVVPNIGGSSLLTVTTAPAAYISLIGCSSSVGDRPRGDVRGRADLRAGSRARRGARAAQGPASTTCRGRSARRRAARSASQTVSGPVVSPACGTECSPSGAGLVEVRLELRPRHADLRAAEPEPDQRGRRHVEVGHGRGRGLDAELPRHVPDPLQPHAVVALGRVAGVLDRLDERLDRHARPDVGVRRAGQLGVADVLRRHVGGDLVGQHPDVLGVADQVDDREVDLDEVGEVAERVELAQRVEVRGHRARGGARRARRRSAARPSRRGGRAARPWAVRRRRRVGGTDRRQLTVRSFTDVRRQPPTDASVAWIWSGVNDRLVWIDCEMTGLDLETDALDRGRRAGHRLRAQRARRRARRRHQAAGRGAGADGRLRPRHAHRPPGCSPSSTSGVDARRGRAAGPRLHQASTAPTAAGRRWPATPSAPTASFLARDMPDAGDVPALPRRRRLLDQGALAAVVPAGLLQRPRQARQPPRARRHPGEHRGAALLPGRGLRALPRPRLRRRQGARRSEHGGSLDRPGGRRRAPPDSRYTFRCSPVASATGASWWV